MVASFPNNNTKKTEIFFAEFKKVYNLLLFFKSLNFD